MKIAMLGLKGLPGIHGGVERHVEELGVRLASRGHQVRIYCRKAYTPEPAEYRGMELVLSPTIHTKHLDATVHTFIASFKAGFSDVDLVHYHAIGPSSMCFIARALGKPVIATIHSLDFMRDKWGGFAKWALRRAESATLLFANRVIAVSRGLADRYSGCGTPVAYIPNGVPSPVLREPRLISEKWGLKGGDYFFWAGRISPEKGVHYLTQAFSGLETDLRLVLAGGGSHTEAYARAIEDSAALDKRILLTGHVSGELLEELYTNARLFVLPSEHEGLPVALLEAMSYGLPCIAADIPACREISKTEEGEEALVFFEARNAASLSDMLRVMSTGPEAFRARAENAKRHVMSHYDWDAVASKVEKEYEALLEGRK